MLGKYSLLLQGQIEIVHAISYLSTLVYLRIGAIVKNKQENRSIYDILLHLKRKGNHVSYKFKST